MNKEKVEWMKIKWLRYEQNFGIIKYKYTLDESTEFQVIDLRRKKRAGPLSLGSIPLSYDGPLPIKTLKKKRPAVNSPLSRRRLP